MNINALEIISPRPRCARRISVLSSKDTGWRRVYHRARIQNRVPVDDRRSLLTRLIGLLFFGSPPSPVSTVSVFCKSSVNSKWRLQVQRRRSSQSPLSNGSAPSDYLIQTSSTSSLVLHLPRHCFTQTPSRADDVNRVTDRGKVQSTLPLLSLLFVTTDVPIASHEC
jgi:hypothetical protein